MLMKLTPGIKLVEAPSPLQSCCTLACACAYCNGAPYMWDKFNSYKCKNVSSRNLRLISHVSKLNVYFDNHKNYVTCRVVKGVKDPCTYLREY
jgi:hypothetical protein